MKKYFVVPFLGVGLVMAVSNQQSVAQPPTPPAAPAGAAAQPALPPMRIDRLDPALDAVIAPGTEIEKVATGFTFSEGPLWREGRLWFADVRGDKLRALSPDGKVELLLDNPGMVKDKTPGLDQGSDGMAPDADGTILAALQGARTVVRIDDKLQETVVLDSYQGKKLNSPNDIVFAPDGAYWFTDPPYGLKGGNRSPDKELPFNAVFRFYKGQLTPAITDLPTPNGIGFSPDGKILYVSNSGPQMYVNAYDVAKDGTVSNPRKLIEYQGRGGGAGIPGNGPGIPDGLKVDTAGMCGRRGRVGFGSSRRRARCWARSSCRRWPRIWRSRRMGTRCTLRRRPACTGCIRRWRASCRCMRISSRRRRSKAIGCVVGA
jgi:gluconolactonase